MRIVILAAGPRLFGHDRRGDPQRSLFPAPPRYRGSATEFWQLAHGEEETGVTIHWMERKVDRGAIVSRDRWPIEPGDDHAKLRTPSKLYEHHAQGRSAKEVAARPPRTLADTRAEGA